MNLKLASIIFKPEFLDFGGAGCNNNFDEKVKQWVREN
jgi:hypothetical protein